jgi:NAD(P)-dependent dehydrogenase (short-subunit alcohol dehydrogenase family)
MTRYFASQAGKKGIFVNSVLPGLIIKDEHKKKYLSKKNIKYRNIVKKTHLTNRFGTIEDVNKVVNFLLFGNNDFINGQSIVVDGGISIEDQFATAHREFG